VARQEFISQLTELGYKVEDLGNNRVTLKYVIPIGRLSNQEIILGFLVQDDFPANPPSGPHISPRLLPINTEDKTHPNGGIHTSEQFGTEWEYWSRPFPAWGSTDHTVRTYMAFIRRLFETL